MLTQNDITILIEALDAWIEKDAAGEIMGDLLGHMVSAKNPDMAGEIQQKINEVKQERKLDRARREEVATLIKATLYRMRRDMDSAQGISDPRIGERRF